MGANHLGFQRKQRNQGYFDMKTGTTCTRCANAATCPAYDARMLYGFCHGFEPRGKWKMSHWNRRALRWLKILGAIGALVRVGEFFKK